MKKFIAAWLAVTALLSSLASAGPVAHKAAAAKPITARPAFEFKGITAGQPADMSLLNACHSADNAQTQCSFKDGAVAGINNTLPPTVYLYDNKISTMLYLFSAKGTDFLTISAALQAKYGPPCKTETQPWQSRAGAHYDNAVLTWCFKTGKLELEQLSTSLDYGDLIYTDDVNKPPTAAPKVDF